VADGGAQKFTLTPYPLSSLLYVADRSLNQSFTLTHYPLSSFLYVADEVTQSLSDLEREATNLPMGWLRLVGSVKLQVFFAKEPYKRDYILQKRLVIFRSLLIAATPYPDILSPVIFLVCSR